MSEPRVNEWGVKGNERKGLEIFYPNTWFLAAVRPPLIIPLFHSSLLTHQPFHLSKSQGVTRL